METKSQPDDKAEVFHEFARLRAAGLPIPPDLMERFSGIHNEGATSGPGPGERVPDFQLPDQSGEPRSVGNLSGPNGLLLIFFRSADW